MEPVEWAMEITEIQTGYVLWIVIDNLKQNNLPLFSVSTKSIQTSS